MSKVFNHADYKSTGNLSVDMVIECIAFYRKCNRPVRTIYLSKYHYDKFDDYFRSNHLGEEHMEALDKGTTEYTIDSVLIKRSELAYLGVKTLTDPMVVDFWPQHRTEENDILYKN